MLTLCALYYIKPSTPGVNVNPVPKGLMLTQFALGTHSAAGPTVLWVPTVPKWLMLTHCALG